MQEIIHFFFDLYTRNSSFDLRLVLIVISIIFLFFIFQTIIFLKSKKAEPKYYFLIVLAYFVYFIFLINYVLSGNSYPNYLIYDVLLFQRIRTIAVTFAWIIVIMYLSLPYIYLRYFSSKFNYKKASNQSENILEYVKSIFSSDKFLSTLGIVLPKGEDDSIYCLYYIPFMLANVEQRRKRFEKSSKRFLTLTISIGAIFSLVILFFGYSLLNEKAAGLPKTVSELEDNLINIENLMNYTDINYFLKEFKKNITEDVELLRNSKLKNDTNYFVKKTNDRINEIYSINVDFLKIENSLIEIRDSLDLLGASNEAFYKNLSNLIDKFQSLKNSRNAQLARLNSQISLLGNYLNKLNEVIDIPENRTTELIKRIAIGLIISTFFLALLRFVVKLYQRMHNEMIKAEEDDLFIRKFYTSYKCAGTNYEASKAVITTFMNYKNIVSLDPIDKELDNSTSNSKIYREFIKNLKKEI